MSLSMLTNVAKHVMPMLVKQKDIWQLGLGSIFRKIHPFLNIYLPATHVIILPLKIFIFYHIVAMIFIVE